MNEAIKIDLIVLLIGNNKHIEANNIIIKLYLL